MDGFVWFTDRRKETCQAKIKSAIAELFEISSRGHFLGKFKKRPYLEILVFIQRGDSKTNQGEKYQKFFLGILIKKIESI